MQRRLTARMAFLLAGVAAAAVVTWVLPVWFVQPSLPAALRFPSEAEAAAWPAFIRAEAGYCFALNAVWSAAAMWLVAGGATLVRARVPARPTRWRRT